MTENFKTLLQSECGQANPLAKLANEILQSENFPKQRLHHRKIIKNDAAEDFAAEYVAARRQKQTAPSSFDLRILTENISTNQSINQKIKADDTWPSEYLEYRSKIVESDPRIRDNLDIAWDNIICTEKADNELKWSFEYLAELENQFSNANIDYRSKRDVDWIKEFKEFLSHVDRTGNEMSSSSVATQSDLEIAWNGEADSTEDSNNQHEKIQTPVIKQSAYEFNSVNPYNGSINALAEGKKCHAAGDLINAILYFEEAVQQEPMNAEAWQYLGQAQAENELESKTIAALKKCLELDTKNTAAMLTLATAYTNEYMVDNGCQVLLDYTKANSKCAKFVQNMTIDGSSINPFFNRQMFQTIENILLRTANEDPEDIDADIQNAMGILYHMSGDLDKAADCFRTALTVRPQDARLWNRLGATLANSQNSTDAIHAYRKALELYPAFVRARYNLGVSCLNLGSHELAIEHFITALSLQSSGIGPETADLSSTIWSTFRLATASLKSSSNQKRLLEFVDAKDLPAIKSMLNYS